MVAERGKMVRGAFSRAEPPESSFEDRDDASGNQARTGGLRGCAGKVGAAADLAHHPARREDRPHVPQVAGGIAPLGHPIAAGAADRLRLALHRPVQCGGQQDQAGYLEPFVPVENRNPAEFQSRQVGNGEGLSLLR